MPAWIAGGYCSKVPRIRPVTSMSTWVPALNVETVGSNILNALNFLTGLNSALLLPPANEQHAADNERSAQHDTDGNAFDIAQKDRG
jgi:hypothetical protein